RKGFSFARALAVMAALALAACSGAPSPTAVPGTATTTIPTGATGTPATTASPVATPTVAPTPTPEPTPEPTPTDTADFPVTLTDDRGTDITLLAKPERIVSLSPANTEIVFALGEGDTVVGGTDADDYPEGAGAPTDVVVFGVVNAEQIVDLEPDLVLAADFTAQDVIDKLRGVDIPVMVINGASVDAVVADITLVGQATGTTDLATQITVGMLDRIDQVAAAVLDTESRPRVFYEIDATDAIYGPAEGSFLADLVEMAGGAAITTGDPAVYSIALEQLLADDPEIIILGDAIYGTCPEQVHDRDAWQHMTAVEDDAIRPVDDTIVTRPGPRLAEGLAALAVAIHPELELVPAPPPVTACTATR
ncbi:MAG: helical backbone metal receptor, partial [Candidatus Limnocylindrales bacterium]